MKGYILCALLLVCISAASTLKVDVSACSKNDEKKCVIALGNTYANTVNLNKKFRLLSHDCRGIATKQVDGKYKGKFSCEGVTEEGYSSSHMAQAKEVLRLALIDFLTKRINSGNYYTRKAYLEYLPKSLYNSCLENPNNICII